MVGSPGGAVLLRHEGDILLELAGVAQIGVDLVDGAVIGVSAGAGKRGGGSLVHTGPCASPSIF